MKRQRNPRGRLIVRMEESRGVVVGLAERDKWSPADVLVLRGELRRLGGGGWRRISIDLRSVMILPSGFFGMLCEWLEEQRGELYLLHPQKDVRRTLWFRLFTEEESDGEFRFFLDPRRTPPAFVDHWVGEGESGGRGDGVSRGMDVWEREFWF